MPELRNSSTMKALFSVILAFAVCIGSVEAGPVRTARHVAKNTAITAKNVAHSTVKGTRRAVHTVVGFFTPYADETLGLFSRRNSANGNARRRAERPDCAL